MLLLLNLINKLSEDINTIQVIGTEIDNDRESVEENIPRGTAEKDSKDQFEDE